MTTRLQSIVCIEPDCYEIRLEQPGTSEALVFVFRIDRQPFESLHTSVEFREYVKYFDGKHPLIEAVLQVHRARQRELP
jgi:hypothetical protein